MPEESAAPAATTDQNAQTTADEPVNNTGAETSGAVTQPAQNEAPTEKTFTQAELDRIVQTRLKSAVKAELKKLTADDDEKPKVEDLQRQLSEAQTKTRSYEARETVRDYLSDPENKLNVKSDSIGAIVKLVMPDLEYDDDGKVINLKQAVKAAQSLAPALFANTPGSIDAAAGRNGAVVGSNMNSIIRQAAGHG